MAVGDLHVENFGTWRDIEGRLVWGVNDFDEAHPLSYANDALPTVKVPPPISAIDAIEHLMPVRRIPYRIAGLGSLGHARYVALANWCRGKIAREAKALAPSACSWAEG